MSAGASVARAIAEALRLGLEVYRAARAGDEVRIVRAPRGVAERARAEAERIRRSYREGAR